MFFNFLLEKSPFVTYFYNFYFKKNVFIHFPFVPQFSRIFSSQKTIVDEKWNVFFSGRATDFESLKVLSRDQSLFRQQIPLKISPINFSDVFYFFPQSWYWSWNNNLVKIVVGQTHPMFFTIFRTWSYNGLYL